MRELEKIYLMSETHNSYGKDGKFGHTKQPRLNDRKLDIENYYKKNYTVLAVQEFYLTKSEVEFIESYIRLEFEKNGYTIIGNDHFKTNNTKISDFKKEKRIFNKAIKKALKLI